LPTPPSRSRSNRMQGFLVNILPVPLATVVDSEPVPKDTLQDLQNELLATKARLQESEAKLKENEKALAQATEEVGLLRERVTKEEEKEKDSCPFGDRCPCCRCPCCTKTFTEGLWHPASQKLYQHMGTRYSWDRTGWNWNFSY
jgi:hypothetical protein